MDEARLPDETPEQLVGRLARLKAQAVAATEPHALIIGSDQVAVCGGEVLGKPGTMDNAEAQLSRLSGQTVMFLTGLCLLNSRTGDSSVKVVETPVVFRPLTAVEISDYVQRERPLDCAGAFKSEGLGITLFESIGGTDPDALIGLPLIELCTMLRSQGIVILGKS